MGIYYNPGKSSYFNGNIHNAVENLKRAEYTAQEIVNSQYPTTIIGKRFNKKSIADNNKSRIRVAYKKLNSVQQKVQEQIDRYNAAERKALLTSKGLGKKGSPSTEIIRALLAKYGYDYDAMMDMQGDYFIYRFLTESFPDEVKRVWLEYDVMNNILTETSGVLDENNIILTETNPLDENYELRTKLTPDMLEYVCFIENTFEDSSQCQGATWIGDDILAFCDIDGHKHHPDCGCIRFIRTTSDPDYIERKSNIEVVSHSNDVAYIPEDDILLHPNHETKEVNVFYLNEDYKVEDKSTVKNKRIDGIGYDKDNKTIVTTDCMSVEVYNKDDFLNGKESKTKTMIPDAITDEKNGMYYNQRGGIAVKDGKMYVGYTGYEKDKRSYDVHNKEDPDIPKGNMVAIYDCETGKCEGRIMNDNNGEVESVSFDDDGNLIWFLNCENDTYVLRTDMSKAKKLK